MPVFSFEKLANVDTHLGPEMKSTGEVLGLASTLSEALYKGLVAAGYKMKKKGGIFITVRNSDKAEIAEVAKKFKDMDFTLYATTGTAQVLRNAGLDVVVVEKIHENTHNIIELIESGKIDYVISTSSKGKDPVRDSVKIRRKTVERAIPCLTSIDTANALADSMKSRYSQINIELVDINHLRTESKLLHFVKMQGIGNDYIYFDCLKEQIDNPEGLSLKLCDRHMGIGGDGVVLICPSEVADAKMRMFNLDGSEGKMCGNAVRCVGKYLYENGIVPKERMTIETLSGIKNLELFKQYGAVTSVRVDMGRAELNPKRIPVDLEGDKIIDQPVTIAGNSYRITCVSMGNPHCVIFVNAVEHLDLERIGPSIEYDNLFPERVNVEFAKVENRNTIKMRV